MRIGIMGGTFNPPHMGHINAARAAKERIPLERIILIPTGVPPHKSVAKNSASTGDRLEMTRLAAKLIDAEVSDIEVRREGKSFTVDTLRELKKSFPDDELWLIMGTDMFLSIETWREFENILKLASVAAIPRDDKDIEVLKKHSTSLSEKYGAVSRIIETEAVTISSSELRPDIKSDEFLKFLPDDVYDYIKEKNLYGISGRD